MTSVGTPAETRSYILERLVGETGEPERVIGIAQLAVGRIVEPVAKALLEILDVAVAVEAKDVELLRLVDARPAPDAHAVMALATTAAPAETVLLILDADALALIVSTLFGGDPDLPVAPIARDPSPLEAEVAASVLTRLAEIVNAHGTRGLGLQLPLPPLVFGAESGKLALKDAPAVRIAIGIATKGAKGLVQVVMPERVLLKERTGGSPADRQPGANAWGARFGEEVMRSAVEVVATMPIGRLTLGELSVLEIGQVIPFSETAQGNVVLAARGRDVFTCEFGKLGQNYTVRVRQPFGHDLIDDLLPSAARR